MATYTYEQLKGMTVVQLREIVQGIQDASIEGYSTMHKDHLLPVLCGLLNVPTHHAAAGAGKSAIKGRIHQLKEQRVEALEAHDYGRLHVIRREMHTLKHRLRRMAQA